MSLYSAILVIGGDGTISEVISGMLQRTDDKRLPIAVVPNGRCNDFCKSLGITSVEGALDFLLKRETISVDTVRVLIDTDSERGLPTSTDLRMKACRFMVAGVQMSMPAKIIHGSHSFPYFGYHAWTGFWKGVGWQFGEDQYRVEIDGEKQDASTGLMSVGNGKYINGGSVYNPFGCVNDGLIDITWCHDSNWSGYWGMSGLIKKANYQGGTQFFDGASTYKRGKSIRLSLATPNGTLQPIVIDNEELTYTENLRFDVADGLRKFNV